MKISILFLLIASIQIIAAPYIIHPGSPGSDSELITPEQAIQIADTSFTKDDITFMKQMIVHHQQALTMSSMAPERTNSKDILELAGRIEGSQEDEISFMQEWLADRNISSTSHHHGHHMKMMGMASPEELMQLSSSQGVDFAENL